MRCFLSRTARCAVPFALVGALTTACSQRRPAEPSPFGTSRPVAVAEEIAPYAGSALGISLLSVDSDSRCPTSVTCVTLGTATITLGIRRGRGPTVPTLLIWGTANDRLVAHGVRIVFDSLTPWPIVPGPLLPQSRYAAWLTLQSTGG